MTLVYLALWRLISLLMLRLWGLARDRGVPMRPDRVVNRPVDGYRRNRGRHATEDRAIADHARVA